MTRIAMLVSFVLMVGCGSTVPTAPTAPAGSVPAPAFPGPFPSVPPGAHTLSGEIVDAQAGPIGSVDINVWIQQERIGYSYWWANGRLQSDPTGHFVAPDIPDSRATIFAVRNGYVQPCAMWVDIKNDVSLDVEMISTANADASSTIRPSVIGAALTGVVFETTADGRKPVAGADLWVGDSLDVGVASTRSDVQGAFFLCNLPKGIYVWVSKPGYASWQSPSDQAESGTLEIELQRH